MTQYKDVHSYIYLLDSDGNETFICGGSSKQIAIELLMKTNYRDYPVKWDGDWVASNNVLIQRGYIII